MTAYQTPGVYVEEISTLPPSVAEVSTAIPAFVGYTEAGKDGDKPRVARISSMLDYKQIFGGPAASKFTVKASKSGGRSSIDSGGITRDAPSAGEVSLYYALSLFYANGGGSCYVVSIGDYSAPDDPKDDFLAGIKALQHEDEPTLIVLTDAANIATAADYHELCGEALKQCETLGDRFAILDVKGGEIDDFRDGLGIKALRYGAAYHPYLQTNIAYHYTEGGVKVDITDEASGSSSTTLEGLRDTDTSLYNQIKSALAAFRVELPPSSAVAGAYAYTDRTRGVWKAPANVSLSGVIGPVSRITDAEQASLNIDPTSGKSINAIRAFTGKGTLIWGARTLAGNDNEWRYVSVRRLFNLIEESTRKSTAFAVFEPNDQGTWLKVKGMIDSYLYGLWERGALAGPTPEQAYFVNVGLGKSMTTQDILEGRMIVEIGVAAVRPAEFIILRFTHKLQEA